MHVKKGFLNFECRLFEVKYYEYGRERGIETAVRRITYTGTYRTRTNAPSKFNSK